MPYCKKLFLQQIHWENALRKNNKIYLIILIALSVVNPLVLADIIPPESKYVKRCTKIVNLDKFPNIILMGVSLSPGGDRSSYQINNNTCLATGYRFSTFKIYWMPVNKQHTFLPQNLLLKTSQSNIQGQYLNKNKALKKDQIEYSLGQRDNSKSSLYLYKSKQILFYNNADTSVKIFKKP